MPRTPEVWKIEFQCPSETAERFAEIFNDEAACVAVTAPPRNATATVEAWFEHAPDGQTWTAKLAIAEKLAGTQTCGFSLARVENLDWLKKVAADFPPLTIGLWTIYGSAHRKAVKNHRRKLQIDATNAFGTGEHPTTQGCLRLLGDMLKHPRTYPANALDLGCGSGILAMAFAQTARKPVIAVDLDPVAVEIARNNVKNNGLQAWVTAVQGKGYANAQLRHHAPYALIMANIFAGPLCVMAAELKRHLQPGGQVILSGILRHQANAVLSAHRRKGIFLRKRLNLGEWSALALKKRHP